MFTAILGLLYVCRPAIGFATKWALILSTAFFAFQIVMIPFNGVAGLFGMRITPEYVDTALFNSQLELVSGMTTKVQPGASSDNSTLLVSGLVKNNSKWPLTSVTVTCRVRDPNIGIDSRVFVGSDQIVAAPGKIEFFEVTIPNVRSKPRNGGLREYFCRFDHASM